MTLAIRLFITIGRFHIPEQTEIQPKKRISPSQLIFRHHRHRHEQTENLIEREAKKNIVVFEQNEHKLIELNAMTVIDFCMPAFANHCFGLLFNAVHESGQHT